MLPQPFLCHLAFARLCWFELPLVSPLSFLYIFSTFCSTFLFAACCYLDVLHFLFILTLNPQAIRDSRVNLVGSPFPGMPLIVP